MTSAKPFSDSSTPGTTAPQGATMVNGGVNFAVYAPKASQLFLSLFDKEEREHRLTMFPSSSGVWHIHVKGITEGQRYGFRADGPWAANVSPRFNIHKLLLDPFAREVTGQVKWCEQLFDYLPDGAQGERETGNQWTINKQDSASFTPRSVVRSPDFDWEGVPRPEIPKEQSILYEAHLKGFTFTHPGIPENIRGTYLGMCHPVVISYLKELGITSLELLPVTSKVSEERLIHLGLVNYWGYNPLCLMAPEPSYGISDPVSEMKTMVRELHRAGIEVIMDVVFNHTCEGGLGGPVLNFRGLAEDEYYHMESNQGQLSTVNYSGCGNTLNFDSFQTLKITMDALRCWAEEYQIDGFRFDLAPIMGRQHRHFSPQSPFFFAISQDPVLSQRKMIAEPWDIGPDGYHLTGFPRDWQSWNDRYRDGCRKFWKGEPGIATEMAWRFTGSEDLFSKGGHLQTMNYICSHDGFTLMDLVSYDQRHNLANGENNRDGDAHNHSWNHGIEGKTDSHKILKARLRSRKNLVSMLMLTKGTPMLMAGDEFGHSQEGNNNAYCQDSKITWLNWQWLNNSNERAHYEEERENTDCSEMMTFTKKMIQFRCNHPLLQTLGHNTFDFYSHEGLQVDPEYFSLQRCDYLIVKTTSPIHAGRSLIVVMHSGKRFMKLQLSKHLYKRWFITLDTSLDNSFCNEPLLNRGWYRVSPSSVVVIEELD
ncbi:glycogen debranching protein GlgX [Sansalvadorimonas verongulae]|uniref:glycogen debranching protein GlgX n=1 Tax=Sansalvadorimonas verongulae TaxID=2172824 RepID=UPI0012BC5512|nr:glycogen debranching protein GlgX [Sansalvadorimonas verongulae]MTI13104.1 glycogen debranching enzyme GlgX [Sansalvadorimonas verongulae]